LSAPNEPEGETNNFVFLHGYNVDPEQARGWQSEIFKRMYWSGSRAHFYGVTWRGSDSKDAAYGFFTPNYHTNAFLALSTGPILKDFLTSLSGTNILAAHSLGNMVVLDAISEWNAPISAHFMIDAAVAAEAIDGSSPVDTNMIYSTWRPYAERLFASDWYQLFPTNDRRSELTWFDRFSDFHNTDLYNFYSSGEEVLRSYSNDPPSAILSAVVTEVWEYFKNSNPFGTYAWVWQEKAKGSSANDRFLGSSHGGWRFNTSYDTNANAHLSPSGAAMLSDVQLRTNAFFDLASLYGHHPDETLFTSSGSAYAQTNRNRILSDAIPALTWAVGANSVSALDDFFGEKRNFDINTEFRTGWPSTRTATEQLQWHHSDCREVAYQFVHTLYDEIVNKGGLK
jgi:hypothetical protein